MVKTAGKKSKGAPTGSGGPRLRGQGSRGRHNYIDGQLQKRSRYYIFRDWANTPDAVLAEAGPRRKVVATAPGQCLDAWQWRQPRESRTVFKNHADHVFGGQTWLDVLSQMGGCPCEFMARRARARATREGAITTTTTTTATAAATATATTINSNTST